MDCTRLILFLFSYPELCKNSVLFVVYKPRLELPWSSGTEVGSLEKEVERNIVRDLEEGSNLHCHCEKEGYEGDAQFQSSGQVLLPLGTGRDAILSWGHRTGNGNKW